MAGSWTFHLAGFEALGGFVGVLCFRLRVVIAGLVSGETLFRSCWGVGAEHWPALRTGTLVENSLGAHPELARWFVPRTNHKRRAQTAGCLYPRSSPRLRPVL